MFQTADGVWVIWYGSSSCTGYEGWPWLNYGEIKPDVSLAPTSPSGGQAKILVGVKGSTVEYNIIVTHGASYAVGTAHDYKELLRTHFNNMSKDAAAEK